jgi:hypothetical protein
MTTMLAGESIYEIVGIFIIVISADAAVFVEPTGATPSVATWAPFRLAAVIVARLKMCW